MTTLSRRTILKSAITGAAAVSVPSLAGAMTTSSLRSSSDDLKVTPRKGRIKQSVSRWCYQKIELDELCKRSAEMGLKAVDLLGVEEWDVPHVENHAKIEEAFRKNIPIAAKMGVPNVITFSGNRMGMSDDEGAKNTVIGLNKLKKIAEDNGVTICLELLNSKVDHKDYMCDHTAWGVRVVQEVNSPRVKLLYDIYHMQIMEGDLIRTIQQNIQWLGHFHTGGNPGRHELDNTQEVHWDAVMRGIASTNYSGYVAHEFVPTRDPLTSLREAADLCDV